MGKSPTMTPFLQIVWCLGPTFILWQIWLERNHKIFRGVKLPIPQVWHRVVGMIQEIVEAKCEGMLHLDRGDADIMDRLGF